MATIYQRWRMSTFQEHSAKDLQFGLNCWYKFWDFSLCHILTNEVPKLPIQQVLDNLSSGVKQSQDKTVVTNVSNVTCRPHHGMGLTHVDNVPRNVQQCFGDPNFNTLHTHNVFLRKQKKINPRNFHDNKAKINKVKLKEFSMNLALT
jgi:hypothetical protein